MAELLSPADGAAQQASAMQAIERRLSGLETARNAPSVLAPVAIHETAGATDTVTTLAFNIPPGGFDCFYVAFAWDQGDATTTEAWLECLGVTSGRFLLPSATGSVSFAWCRPGGGPWPAGPLTTNDDGTLALMRLYVEDTGNTATNETVVSQIHAVWLRSDSHPSIDADDSGSPTLSPFVI